MSNTRPMRSVMSRLPALRAKATGNAGVLFGSTLTTAVLRFASNIVIARLLTPADFGVMIVVTSIATTLMFLSEMGIGPFTVRTQNGATPRALDTQWTVAVIRGALIALVMVASAPLAATAFDDPRLTDAIRVSAIAFFAFECRSMSLLVAQREQNERKNALVRLGVFVAQLPFLLGFAWWLRDYWAFVYALIVMNVFTTAATFLFYPQRHRFLLDREVLIELWRFSRVIAATSAVGIVIIQFDRYFIAAVADEVVLGLFAVALTFGRTIEDMIGRYARSVYMPIVAASLRQGPGRVRTYYGPLRVTRPALVALCCAGITAGPAFIEVVFPPAYVGAGAFLSLLSLRAALEAIARPNDAYLIADGGQSRVFAGEVARLVWTVAAATLAYFAFGLYAFVLAVCLRELPSIAIQTHGLIRRGVFSLRNEASVPLAALAGLACGQAASLAAHGLGLTS